LQTIKEFLMNPDALGTRHCRGLIRRQALRYRKEAWETIEDVVSDERRLNIVWQDELSGEHGRAALWSWPYDLAALALGHVLLDIRPGDGVLSRQCRVSKNDEDEYAVTLGARREERRPNPPSGIRGDALFRAMHAFIKAEGQWDGTGCFHRAGIFDPASGRFLARAEDIGRHNCLDRLAGWSAMQAVRPDEMILFLSARITASLCAKALRAGFSVMVSRSAVTTAAIELADERHACLVGFARTDEERLTLFTDSRGRIAVDPGRA
jgi:FdhD protein